MFNLFDESTAPVESQPLLQNTQQNFKMIPNLERTLAASPVALKAYTTLWDLFALSTLSAVEQQVVYQTANFVNNCEYCVPWHTLLSQQAGMQKNDIEALRIGAPLSDSKLESLRQFTLALIHANGNISEYALVQFIEAGFKPEQAFEVIVGIATKTISNYSNSLAGTPLDKQVKSLQWRKPTIEMRES